jgi:hypothetical protein
LPDPVRQFTTRDSLRLIGMLAAMGAPVDAGSEIHAIGG